MDDPIARKASIARFNKQQAIFNEKKAKQSSLEKKANKYFIIPCPHPLTIGTTQKEKKAKHFTHLQIPLHLVVVE